MELAKDLTVEKLMEEFCFTSGIPKRLRVLCNPEKKKVRVGMMVAYVRHHCTNYDDIRLYHWIVRSNFTYTILYRQFKKAVNREVRQALDEWDKKAAAHGLKGLPRR